MPDALGFEADVSSWPSADELELGTPSALPAVAEPDPLPSVVVEAVFATEAYDPDPAKIIASDEDGLPEPAGQSNAPASAFALPPPALNPP